MLYRRVHTCINPHFKNDQFYYNKINTGAGKTTTFGMLTGEFAITSGTAIIDGFDVDTNLKDVGI